MERAAVLIGVSRSGGLTPLQAVDSGIALMRTWVQEQGIPDDRVVVLCDLDQGREKVTASDIKTAIDDFGALGTIEQLIVYFAGHGVNIGYNEFWMLSGAPRDTQQAVNVTGSERLARTGEFAHVVMISDACRTAASGLKAQRVTGSEIFPNLEDRRAMRPVDIFWGTRLGAEAHEVRRPEKSMSRYHAVFTESVVAALRGEEPDALETTDGAPEAYVHPRRLRDFLLSDVNRRMRSMGIRARTHQEPDAQITSDPEVWLSRVPAPPAPAADRPDPRRREVSGEVSQVADVRVALRRALGLERRAMPGAGSAGSIPPEYRSSAPTDAPPTGTDAAILVDGDAIAHVEGEVGPDAAPDAGARRTVSLDGAPWAARTATLASGRRAVVPLFAGRYTALGFRDGELVDIATGRADGAPRTRVEVRAAAARAALGALARMGSLHLADDEAEALVDLVEEGGAADLGLLVPAAYAIDDARRHDLVERLAVAAAREFGAAIFDLELLAGRLTSSADAASSALPPCPLLTRGWAILGAEGVGIPPEFARARVDLLPSRWTLFGDGEPPADSSQGEPHGT